MKIIKDYLHLYLGCKLERGGTVTYGLLHSLSKTAWNEWENIKPILRPLSDMTEDERKQFTKETPQSHTTNFAKEIQREAETINWLRKRFFDCDGLIESGLAIDKTAA